MEAVPVSATDLSLLTRLVHDPGNEAAWRDFVQRYGRQIYLWCRRWQLQDADAEDVTQIVLVILAQKMREFRYDPAGSFRAWLKTVAHHAWSRYVSGLQRPGQGSGDSKVQPLLETVEARDDLAVRLEEEFDRELLDLAMLRVAQRVEPHTWKAFQLLAIDGLSGAEAANQLGIQVGMVYVAKGRVQKLLQEEVRLLERGQ
jgi:RNA polymerase sigma-70 factor (ECF subfamily)